MERGVRRRWWRRFWREMRGFRGCERFVRVMVRLMRE